MKRQSRNWTVLFALVMMCTACGGGDGGGSTGSNTTAGEHSIVTAVRNSAPLSACATGGIQVDAGIDANGNGVLDPAEVTSSQYVCNGAAGNDGLTTLASVTNEPVGANCTSGGKKVSVGKDANKSGVLDSNEILSADYICNGSAGPGVTWVNVTGTSQQAASNTGYMANNSAQVTITLPPSPAVGDIIQVSGVGSGGWKVSQNAGQSIIVKDIVGNSDIVWPIQDTNRDWYSVASSADGTKLVAVVNGGQIYTSTDSGVAWIPRASVQYWVSVASSADGIKLVAVEQGGQIYTSTDSGVTWTPRDTNRAWQSVASSADGTKLVAGVNMGYIYTSIDSGVTWTPHDSARWWSSLASSSDGTKIVAALNNGSQIFTSTDSGITWTPRASVTNWSSVASSSDGTKLVAVVDGGQIYTSTDSGVTWTPRDSNRFWRSVASSSDGTRLVAAVSGGQIYISTDSGATWTQHDSNRLWYSVALSSDGTKLVAVAIRDRIYTSTIPHTTVGTVGSISGSQFDAIELQYIGNNTFTVLSHEGYLNVQ